MLGLKVLFINRSYHCTKSSNKMC